MAGGRNRKSGGGSPLPQSLPASGSNASSLGSLRRVDPAITEVLASATHATLYDFVNEEWERGDVEGPLFIAKREGAWPRYRMVVLNRSSLTNLVEDVDRAFEVEVVDRYLIFRRSDGEGAIRGLWFHSLEEHAAIGQLLEQLVAQLAAIPDQLVPPPAPPPPPPAAAAKPPAPAAAPATPVGGLLSPGALLSPAALAAPPPAPSLDLETFKNVLRDLVEDDAFVTELHIRYQDKLTSGP